MAFRLCLGEGGKGRAVRGKRLEVICRDNTCIICVLSLYIINALVNFISQHFYRCWPISNCVKHRKIRTCIQVDALLVCKEFFNY